MAISFNNALGIHADALQFRAARAEMLASNMANADTPGYKARDMRFADVLKGQGVQSAAMTATHERHLQGRSSGSMTQVMYRTPVQPSVDGNTVHTEFEQAEYMRNALEFQASFRFLDGKFSGLMKALGSQ